MRNCIIGKKSRYSILVNPISTASSTIKITSILLILLLATSTSYASSSNPTGAKWLFAGATFNYTVTTNSNLNNITGSGNHFISIELIKIVSIGNRTFNASYSINYGYPPGRTAHSSVFSFPLNFTPINSYIQKSLEYSAPLAFGVNSSILKSISSHAVLYLNYLNASSPLNISSVKYNYSSSEIPAYKLSAIEHHPGGENSSFQMNVTFYIDAFSGVVLYYYENDTYPESHYFSGSQILNGTNVPLIGHSYPEMLLYLFILLLVSVIIAVSVVAYLRKHRRA